MKQMKKVLSLVLVCLVLAGLLAGCGENMAEKMEALSGTWVLTCPDSEEQARVLLENIDLFEEEMALADLSGLNEVRLLKLEYSGDYSFSMDSDGMRDCVYRFYADTFDRMYEGRASLESLYGDVSFADMSKEEFQAYYAALYSYDDFGEMLNHFADIAYKYEELEEPWETGTFHLDRNKIKMLVTGETEEAYVTYVLQEGTLTLTYSNGEEVYTRKQ